TASAHVFGQSIRDNVIQPFKDLMGLFQAFPEVTGWIVRGIQIIATSIAYFSDVLDAARADFSHFAEIVGKMAAGDFVGAWKLQSPAANANLFSTSLNDNFKHSA